MRIWLLKTSVLLSALLWMLSPHVQAQTYVAVGLNQPPLLTANAGSTTDICEGDSATIGGQPTAIGGSGANYTYVWNPSVLGIAGSNPTFFPTDTTTVFLMVTDANGCTATDTVTVNVQVCVGTATAQQAQLRIFPNPSNGSLRVELKSMSPMEAMQLTVVDALGKIAFRAELPANNGNYRQDIDLTSLSKGAYFVHVRIGEQQLSQKLILQ